MYNINNFSADLLTGLNVSILADTVLLYRSSVIVYFYLKIKISDSRTTISGVGRFVIIIVAFFLLVSMPKVGRV